MDRKYTVVGIQLDNKYPEKQSDIYFTNYYRYSITSNTKYTL